MIKSSVGNNPAAWIISLDDVYQHPAAASDSPWSDFLKIGHGGGTPLWADTLGSTCTTTAAARDPENGTIGWLINHFISRPSKSVLNLATNDECGFAIGQDAAASALPTFMQLPVIISPMEFMKSRDDGAILADMIMKRNKQQSSSNQRKCSVVRQYLDCLTIDLRNVKVVLNGASASSSSTELGLLVDQLTSSSLANPSCMTLLEVGTDFFFRSISYIF